MRINRELQEELEPYIAGVDSEEGQAEIHGEGTHVTELWEDGEMTSTKSGDLYGRRLLHQSVEPWLPRNEVLWDVPEGKDNKRMVVLDRDKVKEILREYAEEKNIDVYNL